MPKRRGNGWTRPRKRVILIKNVPPEHALACAAVDDGEPADPIVLATVDTIEIAPIETADTPPADVAVTDDAAETPSLLADAPVDPFEPASAPVAESPCTVDEIVAAVPPKMPVTEDVEVAAPPVAPPPLDPSIARDAVAATFMPGAPMTDDKMFPFANAASAFRMLDTSRLQEEFFQMFSRNEASWCEFVLVMLRRQGRRVTLTYQQLHQAMTNGHREVIQLVRRYFTLKEWANVLVSV